jgi:hypothetical protein
MNGALFGEKHSYRDWGLILKSRPVISPPSPKTTYIDNPGTDGQLDLTESLTGDIAYDNRIITLEFNVIDSRKRWSNIYSEILDYLHGRQMKLILDEDSSFYYEGRFQVNEWKSDKKTSTITIEGNVEPYKYEKYSSLDDWLWDEFNFENGIIREYKELRVDGTLKVVIEGRRKRVIPSFLVTSDDGKGLQVSFDGSTYDLKDGKNIVVDIRTVEGTNTLTFTGNGTVSIDYRGGRL